MKGLIQHNICDQDIKQKNKIDHGLNIILRKKQTHLQLAEYLHKACLSPNKEDIHQSHKMKKIHTWPGLIEELVKKHLPKSISTKRGHMTSERKILQSNT